MLVHHDVIFTIFFRLLARARSKADVTKLTYSNWIHIVSPCYSCDVFSACGSYVVHGTSDVWVLWCV